MSNDMFSGLGGLGALGGLLGGIAKSVMPQDSPEGKLMAAQTNLADLQKQETDLMVEIGRAAYAQNPSAWPQDAKLQLIQQNIASAQSTLGDAQKAQAQAEADKAAEDARGRCPNCGTKNPDGVKFCQDCGSPLGGGKIFCTTCGAELPPGTKFCGSCGARQQDA